MNEPQAGADVCTPEIDAQVEEACALVEATDAGPMADTEEKRELYRILRCRARLAAELVRVKAAAESMVRQLSSQLAGIDSFYGPSLRALTRQLLLAQRGKAKSVKTPFGVVGFRHQGERLVLDDAAAILAAVDAGHLPEDLVKIETTRRPVKAALDQLYESTGEIPPGCLVQPALDAFYVKHDER